MDEITFSIHWLGFTVHAQNKKALSLYDSLFKDIFGKLEALGHGGSGYRSILKSALEIKIYLNPIGQDQEHFHFDIPGLACQVLPIRYFRALINFLDEYHPEKYKFTRMDLAFDHLKFDPQDVEEALFQGKVRTLAKRESIRSFNSPFQPRNNGELGTHTVELGANQSDRMITVYNKRGFTRLEFQTRRERSDLVAKELLKGGDKENWFSIMLSHLLDYVDFETDWWAAFKQSQGRANKKVSSVKEITTEKLINWIDVQVSPGLSALEDAYPGVIIPLLIRRGRKKRGNKYDAIFLDPPVEVEDA